jgi:sulfoacetaldehyde dehydrogenase
MVMPCVESTPSFPDIDAMIARARIAMDLIADASQKRIDEIVKALAWAIYRDDHARLLAKMAVEDTGLGNVADKITKNKRKTYGTLCDLMATQTRGLCESDPDRGLYTYLKPVGVIGSLTPSTNPAATPANQALMAVKGGNAIIISPSPAAAGTARKLKEYFDEALRAIGAPTDLFQVIEPPISFDRATYLSRAVDLILVTGDQLNVRRGYRSGTPCIGVGKGNVPVIIDDSADLADAARKICASKTFDNATSCSSENAVIILDAVYDAMLDQLQQSGAYLANPEEKVRITETLFEGGKINRRAVGRALEDLDDLFSLGGKTAGKRYIMVEEATYGPDAPLSGEKLSLVMTVYRASDIKAAMDIVNGILEYEGIGHSVGIHTASDEVAHRLAARTKVARVLVNQAHTFGNGGGMDNGLPFTLSMGCGTWAGNSISENMSIKNFVNKTILVKTFDKAVPERAAMFGDLYDKALDA